MRTRLAARVAQFIVRPFHINTIMNERETANKLRLILCAVVFLALICPAADVGYTTETGGVQIVLPTGWEPLDQPTNFVVQTRARSAEQGIALSAGSFTLDLTLEQYAALGLVGMASGPDAALDKFAKDVGISKEEIEKALSSRIGRQLTDSLKEASRTMRFDLLKVSKKDVEGRMRIEIHSKMVVVKSGQIIFSRQFILAGSSPHEIVQITYASTSEGIFTQEDLADAIRPKRKGK